jgi:hypothetical protein
MKSAADSDGSQPEIPAKPAGVAERTASVCIGSVWGSLVKLVGFRQRRCDPRVHGAACSPGTGLAGNPGPDLTVDSITSHWRGDRTLSTP